MRNLFWVVLILNTSICFGAEMTLRARGSEGLGDVFFSQIASSGSRFTILVNLSCFSSNLRNVSNPVSPMGTVRMNIGIGPNSNRANKNGIGDFAVWFPGWMTYKRGTNLDRIDIMNLTNPNDANKAIVYGAQNTLVILPPNGANPNLGPPPYQRSATMGLVRYINFEQDIQAQRACWGPVVKSDNKLGPAWASLLTPSPLMAGGSVDGPQSDNVILLTQPQDTGFGQPKCDSQNPNAAGFSLQASLNAGYIPNMAQLNFLRAAYQQFMGHDGPLSGEWRSSWSANYRTLIVDAAFPGELLYCGGFFSPLMLFFDGKRPEFLAQSKFKIHPFSNQVSWPEKGSPGYFLALDLNENGKIDDWSEIFGADHRWANGFEKLKDYDANRDGVIDEKDPIFSKLLLWRDRSGVGNSRPQDLHSLKEMGVESINLGYEYKVQTEIADRAMLREKSMFKFKRNRKMKKGEIIDVWLSSR